MAQTDLIVELPDQPFVLPASYAQQRIWFLDRIEAGSSVYNVPTTTRLRGPLDVPALQAALDQVVERHETLRTVFSLVDGVPHQVVQPAQGIALELVDLRASPEPEAEATAIVDERVRESFDLASDMPFRATLVRLGDQDHILCLTLHHIITDAWSMGVLRRELTQLYGGFASGEPAELPELPIQYGDYAAWQRDWMESGGLDGQLAYWTEALRGAPSLLELPTDKPRPAEQSFRGHTLRKVLPRDLLERLNKLGEQEGTTLFMTLLAAFAVLLSRYADQEDVVVATPVANRNRIELESVIGLFVNTLALRVQTGDDPSFSELLARVRETALEAFSNQELPFEKLVQELRPERNQSHAPVAQVLFVVQGGVDRATEFAGLSEERVASDRGTAKFDLSLFAGEVPEGLRIAVEYCVDLFEPETITRMIGHLQTLLESAVADPSCPVSRLGILSAAERELVLGSASHDPAAAADERPVHERVAEQALRTPDVVAVALGAEQLTYAELDARSARLAERLQKLGVGPDVVVAIAAERSVETMVGVLGVLKAGGAYAPIDPSYPAERVEFMLGDSRAPVLLTHRRLLDRLPAHGAETICLDELENQAGSDGDQSDSGRGPDGAAGLPAAGTVTGENLAYVIYTSGSTGRPKGVAMGHGPLSALISWQLDSLPAPVKARTLQFASLSFDVAFQEMFSTWCSGGTLVLIDEDTRRDAHALVRAVSQQGVERMFMPFIALQTFCDAANHLELTLPELREVMTAGEQLKVTESIRRFFAARDDRVLFNHYGPSETHVVTSLELDGDPALWSELPPIGRALPQSRVYVLDRHGEPAPIGVSGELYLGGTSVANGYLHRPELTAERFLPDPFSGTPGDRMYRTGDRARLLADRNFEFLGRFDDQVKIRGFRVELGEVEAMLARHPAVAEAAAAVRSAHPGDSRLVGYVVERDGEPAADADLVAHARRLVPDYMVPQQFVHLTSLPLTPSGKVDRRALPAPTPLAAAVAEPPSTDLERSIAAIWGRLLGIEQVGVDQDFFDLGGHSLLAVQVVHAIENELGLTCTLPMLFRNRTVRELAAELHAGGREATEAAILQLAPGTGPSLFCICGIHAYQELAEELAPDYTVFGVFLPVEQEVFATDGGRRLSGLTVEDMAASYVAAVRKQQPEGPYLLLGFCFGGVVAFEAARRLREAGETVSLLVMLDSTIRSVLGRKRRPIHIRAKKWARQRYQDLPRGIQRHLFGDRTLSDTERLEETRMRIYGRAMRRYRANSYDSPAVLVQPHVSAQAYAAQTAVDPTWGWGAHIASLELCDVPGAHLTHLRRPNVHELARQLRPHLERARREAPQGSVP